MKKRHLIGLTGLIIVWFSVTYFKIVDPFFLPNPWVTVKTLFDLLIAGSIFTDIFSTLSRIFYAFVIAIVIGVPAGLFLGRSENLYKNFEFPIDFFRSIAPLSIFPLFLLLLGIGDASKIGVAAFSATILIIFNTAYGIMNANKSRILAARVMGASELQIFKHILFFESLLQTFIGLRTAMSWIMAVIIATEMFVGTNLGLGHKILDYQITYNIPAVYATILLTGLIGYLINLTFVMLEKYFLHWSGR